jgi:hypothetical protein
MWWAETGRAEEEKADVDEEEEAAGQESDVMMGEPKTEPRIATDTATYPLMGALDTNG